MATTFLCARSRRTPLLMRCGLVSSLLTTGQAMTWLTRLASWSFWTSVPRPSSGRWRSLAWLTGLRVLVLRDSVWTSMRPGFLGEGVRMRGGTSARDPGLFLCLCSQPFSDAGVESFLGVCARSASTQSERREVGVQAPRAPEHAAQRHSSGLTALRGSVVDFLQRGSVVSVLCAVCGSHGGCVVRRFCPVIALVLRLLEDDWLRMRSISVPFSPASFAVAPPKLAMSAWQPRSCLPFLYCYFGKVCRTRTRGFR